MVERIREKFEIASIYQPVMDCYPQPAPFRTVQRNSIQQRQRRQNMDAEQKACVECQADVRATRNTQCQDMKEPILRYHAAQQITKQYAEQITHELRQTRGIDTIQRRQTREKHTFQRCQDREIHTFQWRQTREKARFQRNQARRQATPQQQYDHAQHFEKLQTQHLVAFQQQLIHQQAAFQQKQASEMAVFEQKQARKQNSILLEIQRQRQATELDSGRSLAARMGQASDCHQYQDELYTLPKQHSTGAAIQKKQHSKQHELVKRRAADVQLPPRRLSPLQQRPIHAHPPDQVMESIGGTSSIGGGLDEGCGLVEVHVEGQTATAFIAMDPAASDHSRIRTPSHTV